MLATQGEETHGEETHGAQTSGQRGDGSVGRGGGGGGGGTGGGGEPALHTHAHSLTRFRASLLKQDEARREIAALQAELATPSTAPATPATVPATPAAAPATPLEEIPASSRARTRAPGGSIAAPRSRGAAGDAREGEGGEGVAGGGGGVAGGARVREWGRDGCGAAEQRSKVVVLKQQHLLPLECEGGDEQEKIAECEGKKEKIRELQQRLAVKQQHLLHLTATSERERVCVMQAMSVSAYSEAPPSCPQPHRLMGLGAGGGGGGGVGGGGSGGGGGDEEERGEADIRHATLSKMHLTEILDAALPLTVEGRGQLLAQVSAGEGAGSQAAETRTS